MEYIENITNIKFEYKQKYLLQLNKNYNKYLNSSLQHTISRAFPNNNKK